MMLVRLLLCGLAVLGVTFAQTPRPGSAAPSNAVSIDAELTAKLLAAKRIYVENFGDDSLNKTLQAMLIDSIRSSKRFIITENKEKADLILKGSAIEKTSQEAHALGSGTTVAGAAGGSNERSGSFVARQLGVEDSQASVETVNDARMAVRLVSTDGDVVWSTTQESKGAKYKGATADVADKVVKQLLRDLDRLARPVGNAALTAR